MPYARQHVMSMKRLVKTGCMASRTNCIWKKISWNKIFQGRPTNCSIWKIKSFYKILLILILKDRCGEASWQNLSDSLPDKYGNQLIEKWLAQNGCPPNSMNPVEKLCFI